MGTTKHTHKYNGVCPLKKCNYSSRIPVTTLILNNKNSVHSKLCPTHRTELIPEFKKNKLYEK